MQLAHYLGVLHHSQTDLAAGYRALAEAHADETDVYYVALQLAQQCQQQSDALAPHVDRYGEQPDASPSARFHGPRGPGVGLMRDLQDLYLMVAECDVCWMVTDRAAEGARDDDLVTDARRYHGQCLIQLAWLRTQLTQSAVQALVVA